MNDAQGIRIGEIFGIMIRVAWNWLIILALVLWNLMNVFGRSRPDWGPGLTWGLSIVAALLFFGAVLVHELTTPWWPRVAAFSWRRSRSSSSAGYPRLRSSPIPPGASS